MEIGSSPHLRGTLHRPAGLRSCHRFIPAPAGNTPACSAIKRCVIGSSPHLRGTRSAAARRHAAPRFIPAPAGNTQPPRVPAQSHPVHPRTCGEHSPPGTPMTNIAGSSPHLRGTQPATIAVDACSRFIPAPAGNTLATSRSRRAISGSSPHLRGTRHLVGIAEGVDRFIPAPAGNTPICRSHSRPLTVHPRTCGEHSTRSTCPTSADGSSPHLRGTRDNPRFRSRQRRFIPAPAGNTRHRLWPCRLEPVHPRTCGEHTSASTSASPSAGSSPHLRGTPTRERAFRRSRRFIPAPAGNTEAMGRSQMGRPGSSPHLRGTHPSAHTATKQ